MRRERERLGWFCEVGNSRPQETRRHVPSYNAVTAGALLHRLPIGGSLGEPSPRRFHADHHNPAQPRFLEKDSWTEKIESYGLSVTCELAHLAASQPMARTSRSLCRFSTGGNFKLRRSKLYSFPSYLTSPVAPFSRELAASVLIDQRNQDSSGFCCLSYQLPPESQGLSEKTYPDGVTHTRIGNHRPSSRSHRDLECTSRLPGFERDERRETQRERGDTFFFFPFFFPTAAAYQALPGTPGDTSPFGSNPRLLDTPVTLRWRSLGDLSRPHPLTHLRAGSMSRLASLSTPGFCENYCLSVSSPSPLSFSACSSPGYVWALVRPLLRRPLSSTKARKPEQKIHHVVLTQARATVQGSVRQSYHRPPLLTNPPSGDWKTNVSTCSLISYRSWRNVPSSCLLQEMTHRGDLWRLSSVSLRNWHVAAHREAWRRLVAVDALFVCVLLATLCLVDSWRLCSCSCPLAVRVYICSACSASRELDSTGFRLLLVIEL
ncbi:unnamed protein product [Pleuronectes platessa]|uniref:Uncharacterized protein n=1 Tax=Pleuronectes platessa TaxID=8262 RepID=A0A9N7Z2F9_PLEPL|nr:unnamed protein product [Pleuronectes platessa]